MKRSEMLNKIQKLLDSKVGDDVLPYNLADEVLSLCENAGMVPPFYETVLSTGEKFDRKKHQGKDTGLFMGWEPEGVNND